MNQLKFCMKCGKETLQFDGEKKFTCSNCNFVMFQNCAAAVAVIIRYKDEVLFTKRNQNPKINKYDLAGGFSDPNESAEETCKRELNEELGIDIDIKNLKFILSLPNVYHYKEIDYNTLDLFFEYRVSEKIQSKKLELHEISEIKWIKLSELNLEDIAFDSQKIFFKNYS